MTRAFAGRLWSIEIIVVGLLGAPLAGCGDDSARGEGTGTDSDTDGTDTFAPVTETEGPATSTTSASTSTTGDDTTAGPTDTGVVDDTGSTSNGTTTSGSSTSGTPNTPPTANGDFYLTHTGAAQLVVVAAEGVLANDEDAEGDPLSVASFDATTEQGGTVSMQDDGSFSYTRPADYWGEDRFGYEVDDDGGVTDGATVRIMTAPTAELLSTVAVGLVGRAVDGAAAGDQSGYAVAGGGDVDGDGLGDVVVGANEATTTQTDAGIAYAVFGSGPGGPTSLADVAAGNGGFSMPGTEASGGVGSSVEIAGDVNGDGAVDLVVGAPDEAGGGAAYVVFGKADGTAVPLDAAGLGSDGFRITAAADGDELGHAVGPAGDVNGDGLADVVVGAPQGDGSRGMVAVVFGKADGDPVAVGDLGPGSGVGFVMTIAENNADLGNSVRGAGDVDGDGLDDLIVGAPAANPGGIADAGRAFVVFGKQDDDDVDLDAVASGTGGFVIDGAASLDLTGHAVSGAGDVNGDGRADVIVGAHGTDVVDDATGRVYVVFGKMDTDAVSAADIVSGVGGFVINGEGGFDFAGWSVGAAGDVDGDGLGDVVLGATGVDDVASNAGRAYVVWGKDDTAPVDLADVATGMGGFSLDGQASTDAAGWSVDGAGDFDGDGFADVIIGSYEHSPDGMNDAGRSYVVLGGDYRGVTSGEQTSGADILYGTSDPETLVGGSGDDELFGAGGADVLYGGPGDDVIVLVGPSDFFRVDGGTGEDTLRLEGADISLDLTNFFDLALVGIERIDLTGNGDNDLFLELRDLRALSPTSTTLSVVGDAGDGLVADLQGAGFADLGSVGGQTSYGNGVLTLVVDDDLDAFVQL